MKTIFEIIRFGDFDMPYTESIMISDKEYDKARIINDFLKEEGLNYLSFDGDDSIENVPWDKAQSVNDNFKAYLELLGFVELKTERIFISD